MIPGCFFVEITFPEGGRGGVKMGELSQQQTEPKRNKLTTKTLSWVYSMQFMLLMTGWRCAEGN